MKEVLTFGVEIVKFIRAWGLNHRQFKSLLKECDADYKDDVYFSHVRWLSKAATLKRFWNLLPEIKQFFIIEHRDITLLENCEWLNDLAFLIDITQMLSDQNLKLQGKDQLVHKMFEHVESFLAKIMLIINQLLSKKTISQHYLRAFLKVLIIQNTVVFLRS